MNKERVVHYSSNDWLYGNNLIKIETIEVPTYESISINDVIEFFEIKKYFDEGAKAKTWSDGDYQLYKSKSEDLFKLTMRYINSINDNNLIETYNYIEIDYIKSFWVLFDKCKLYNRISEEVFCDLLKGEHIAPFNIFCHKNIVNKYGKILRDFILKQPNGISIILHVYEQDYTGETRLYLPDELTGSDIATCIESYIDREDVHPNQLDVIKCMQFSSRFPITDAIRYKAKLRNVKEQQRIMKDGITSNQEIEVGFSEVQTEVAITNYNNSKFSITYSVPWLLETLDFPSIMNNFIYVFEFADVPQMRCTLVSKESQLGLFERVFRPKSSRIYPQGTSFNVRYAVSSMQINGYYHFLKKQKIRLEDVLKWVFTEYLQKEFRCSEMRVLFPSEGTTYLEKCSMILTAFESVLKQYTTYVKYGAIDFELIGISSNSIKFGDIPSLVKNKYVYGQGKDFENLSNLLFSDQCRFKFVSRLHNEKKNYHTFFDLLKNDKVFLSDYSENDYPTFEYLKKHGIIDISPDGLISLGNIEKVYILKDLFENEVISQMHYSPELRTVISEMVDEGILIEKSTLFSEQESNFYNFILNHSEYSNSWDLRNSYIHGVQQMNMNEEEHRQNYFVFLILFVVLAIKINDDFCLLDATSK